MKFSSVAEDSSLSERFRFTRLLGNISGVGERFVDVTGGEADDWMSESFSLSFKSPLLFVRRVIDRLIKLMPDEEGSNLVIFSLLLLLLLLLPLI